MKPLYSIVLIAFFSLWIRSIRCIRRIRPFWGNPDLGIQKAATAHSAGTKKFGGQCSSDEADCIADMAHLPHGRKQVWIAMQVFSMNTLKIPVVRTI